MDSFSYIQNDPYLKPYETVILDRLAVARQTRKNLLTDAKSLSDFANGHRYFGCHQTKENWIFREWAPNSTGIQLVGVFNDWNTSDDEYKFIQTDTGIWELKIPIDRLSHQDEYKLLVSWPGGSDYRLSPWSKRVIQDDRTKLFNEQIWNPDNPVIIEPFSQEQQVRDPLLIYEAHVGMSSEEEKVSGYEEFRLHILPRIIKLGYNAIQLMAIQEHPYYGSFGYHVSNFFAPSSRFGTPEELKKLINDAHASGLQVIMDIVHSHAVKNILEGPGLFDGVPGMFFHTDQRRNHQAWDSLCFDYGKPNTLHFLLSNCKYWIEDFGFDGFRFDGVTSMLYFDHGLERSFTSYDAYYDSGVDKDALTYLILANDLIKEIKPDSVTIAEDMSGMPGLAIPVSEGGIGFDYRLAMGVPDFWIKTIKEKPDESWNVNQIYYELTNKRQDERVISYAESHDQALVGDKTLIFRLADKEMYTHMAKGQPSLIIDRAIALHKTIRLITLATNGGGYLNFMGNEFGHPEWIDFPREGNNWSYQYARRQWNLPDNNDLKYTYLNSFDQAMIKLFSDESNELNNGSRLVTANEGDQVLVFRRGDFYFLINLNPTQSFSGYGIPGEAADYKIVLNTDNPDFGGFGRVDESVLIESEPVSQGSGRYQMKVYLPSRTALVIKKIHTPSLTRK